MAEVQAPAQDAVCEKEGAVVIKEAAANATEVAMGTSDPVGCFSSFTGFLLTINQIHCCSALLTAEDLK